MFKYNLNMALLYIMTYDNLCELICWKLLFLILGADSAMGVDKTDRRQIWGEGGGKKWNRVLNKYVTGAEKEK